MVDFARGYKSKLFSVDLRLPSVDPKMGLSQSATDLYHSNRRLSEHMKHRDAYGGDPYFGGYSGYDRKIYLPAVSERCNPSSSSLRVEKHKWVPGQETKIKPSLESRL